MSDQTGMNRELKQLEAELKQVSLPASSVDRDETLYQSGWAAGIASLGDVSNRKNRAWYWPATSGVLAMVAAVLAVMLVAGPGGNTGEGVDQLASERKRSNDRLDETKIVQEEVGRAGVGGAGRRRGHVLNRMDLARLLDDYEGSLSRAASETIPGSVDDVEIERERRGMNRFELMRQLVSETGVSG